MLVLPLSSAVFAQMPSSADPQCGAANSMPSATMPTTALCSVGVAGPVLGNKKNWWWHCHVKSESVLCLAPVAGSSGPQIYEQFGPAWPGNVSPDGVFRINGNWVGTGGDEMLLADVVMANGAMSMTVPAKVEDGGEIQSLALPGYGYGYYEAQMQPSAVPGVVVSMFWIQAGGSYTDYTYGPGEWDIEFLTSDFSGNVGAVRYTTHPSGLSYKQVLPFNPSAAMHRYGFLWTPSSIVYTVDGVAVHTVTVAQEPTIASPLGGYIMANVWTGTPSWGGGPPAENATSVYDWIKFWPGVSSIPAN
jgi:hypothetical protein